MHTYICMIHYVWNSHSTRHIKIVLEISMHVCRVPIARRHSLINLVHLLGCDYTYIGM